MVRSMGRLALAAGGGVGVVLVVLTIMTVPSAATLSESTEAQAASLVNPGFEGLLGSGRVDAEAAPVRPPGGRAAEEAGVVPAPGGPSDALGEERIGGERKGSA